MIFTFSVKRKKPSSWITAMGEELHSGMKRAGFLKSTKIATK
jgi:hypothetical protein